MKTSRFCTISDCLEVCFVKGWCKKHYKRFLKHGDPLIALRKWGSGKTPELRFWTKANLTANTEKCWEWQGKLNDGGYGETHRYINNRKQAIAHRVAFFFFYGVDPGNLLVCHKCDNRKCINPYHLFLGTSKDNTQDMLAKGRGRKSKKQLQA